MATPTTNPGRPRRAKQVADRKVFARVTPGEMRRIKAQAKAAGLSVSDWVRERLLG